MLKDLNSLLMKLQGNKSDPLYPSIRDIHDRLSQSLKRIQHTLQWKDAHLLKHYVRQQSSCLQVK